MIDTATVLSTLDPRLHDGGMRIEEFEKMRDAALGRLGQKGLVTSLKGVKLDKTLKATDTFCYGIEIMPEPEGQLEKSKSCCDIKKNTKKQKKENL